MIILKYLMRIVIEFISTKKGIYHFLKRYTIRGSLITQQGSASEFYEQNLRGRKLSDGYGTLYKVNGMGTKGDGLGYRFIMQPEKKRWKQWYLFSRISNFQ